MPSARIISARVYADDDAFGFAYADLSTGEFRLTEAQDRQSLLDRNRACFAGRIVGQHGAESADRRTRSRARIRQLRVSAGTGNFHLVRTFQGQIARRLRLRADARGSRCGGSDRALLESISCGAKSTISLRCAAMRRRITSCSTPPHKPTLSWSNRAARATRVC